MTDDEVTTALHAIRDAGREVIFAALDIGVPAGFLADALADLAKLDDLADLADAGEFDDEIADLLHPSG